MDRLFVLVQEPVLALPEPPPAAEGEAPLDDSAELAPVPPEDMGRSSDDEDQEMTESDIHMQQAIEMSMTGEPVGRTMEEEILGLPERRRYSPPLPVRRTFQKLAALGSLFLVIAHFQRK